MTLGRYMDPERLTRDGHLLKDREEPCPKCGYQRKSFPAWVRLGVPVQFLLDGRRWEILSVGSDNFRYIAQAHRQVALAQPPRLRSGLDRFYPEDLERATYAGPFV
jgi:hypothetical protein